ncbi:MAG: SurA N-terminal domain-containing protein [Paracoccus sp. (in: a-proteobacteria)]|uniref:peptidylprolyl isomerase n=1 Tax=Paracoccus sp. TaxID=267 RepID=UPI0026DECEFF|nr:SurA N-terminal domain-containing protein [Paracoccus sp. (in: a-proteobacteria)]MDO5620617.1 SurA N-terminal domain-containing protein [Paracoccus sp. (in: a-proteobacteria)]
MSSLRTHGKSTLVWLLMGMLLLGLAGFGIENFAGSTSSDVARVGNVSISQQDYTRNLQSETQQVSMQLGRALSADEAQALGLPQMVQARLLAAATLENEAQRLGVSVGDAEVAQQISDTPAFQLNGRFDRSAYQELLRREGISTAQFENDVRMDTARRIIQQAVTSGAPAPDALVRQIQAWALETRDLRWQELTADQLANPVATPDDATVESWYQANIADFTAPERKRLTYAWLSPDQLAETVQIDEQALRDLYQQNIDQYQMPERRMVTRLVFQDEASAAQAKADLDAGRVTLEQLAEARGLTLDDLELGEQTQAQLGEAGNTVFATAENGIVGLLATNLGPALFSVNAILDPVDISFEEARTDLRAEAAADRARRVIEERSAQIEDALAGGASIEDLGNDFGMTVAAMEYDRTAEAQPDDISAFPQFRELADRIAASDFPELTELADGGVFALRLDEVIPAAPMPLDEIRDRVTEDWTRSETHRQLLALADEVKLGAVSATMPQPAPATGGNGVGTPATPGEAARPANDPATAAVVEPIPAPDPNQWHSVAALDRDGSIDLQPLELVSSAFALKEAGDSAVVDADNRVFVVALDAIHAADTEGERAADVAQLLEQRVSQSLQSDLFDYYLRAAQTDAGISLNPQALAAAAQRVQ